MLSGMSKASLAFRVIFVVLLALLVITLVMPKYLAQDGIQVQYHYTIRLVDENGSLVPDQYRLYTRDGVFYPGGGLFSNTSRSDLIENGTTNYSGSISPVSYGSYVVFGASSNERLLKDDWDDRQFSPGSAGYWKVFTYKEITRNMSDGQTASISVTVDVSNKTGHMVKMYPQ